jgi:hypothetical protein
MLTSKRSSAAIEALWGELRTMKQQDINDSRPGGTQNIVSSTPWKTGVKSNPNRIICMQLGLKPWISTEQSQHIIPRSSAVQFGLQQSKNHLSAMV